eukprot:361700-Chlamydomonas_euryale.AAC.2
MSCAHNTNGSSYLHILPTQKPPALNAPPRTHREEGRNKLKALLRCRMFRPERVQLVPQATQHQRRSPRGRAQAAQHGAEVLRRMHCSRVVGAEAGVLAGERSLSGAEVWEHALAQASSVDGGWGEYVMRDEMQWQPFCTHAKKLHTVARC